MLFWGTQTLKEMRMHCLAAAFLYLPARVAALPEEGGGVHRIPFL